MFYAVKKSEWTSFLDKIESTFSNDTVFPNEVISTIENFTIPNTEVLTDFKTKWVVSSSISYFSNNTASLVRSHMFEGYKELQSFTMDNCKTICSYAFRGTNITNIYSFTLPECEMISDGAFERCQSLTSVVLPKCKTVNKDAFFSCRGITSINLPTCQEIGESAFYSCVSLATAKILQCTAIRFCAFGGCPMLTEISVPVCSIIGNYAFTGCAALSNVYAPGCTQIGSGAFENCHNLQNITLGSCSVIEKSAFAGCFTKTPENSSQGITVSFPECTLIKEGAFTEAGYFSDINSGRPILSMYFAKCMRAEKNAFASCGAGAIYLSICSSISRYAFVNCLASYIELPACQTIDSWAFQGNRYLQSVYIPYVHTIRQGAFFNCYNLRKIELPYFCSRIEEDTFNNCSMLSQIFINHLSASIPITAFVGTLFFSSILYSGSTVVNRGTIEIYVPSSCLAYYKTKVFSGGFSSWVMAMPT